MTHRLWHGAVSKWIAAVGLLAMLVAGTMFLRSAVHTHADAIDGCHSIQEASAKASGQGYTLTVSTYARVGDGNVYCGTMFATAQISEPANGAGGTLAVTLFYDTGSVTGSTVTSGGGTSGATFSASTPREATSCGQASATFTSTSGVSLSASTRSSCPK
jgi:hypothetical protein